MMKLLPYAALFSILATACTRESLLPLPGWEDGATGFGKIESGTFKENGMDTSKMVVSISYNNYGKPVQVNKIEAYVHFVESYYDSTAQATKKVEHAGPAGKTDPTFVINNPEPRVQYPITITPTKVYDLFKNEAFKYNGPSAVNVFQNPEKPRATPAARFLRGDEFYVTWYLYTTDGRVFRSWSESIKNGEVAGANTRVGWVVVR